MARSRFIKPEFFDDTVLARCSHPARLLFAALWQVADRLGVFEWDAPKLRKYAFGYDDITTAQVDGFLSELLRHGFVKHGEFKNRYYGLVVNLAKHQKFHVAEKAKYDDVFAGAIWQASSISTVPAPTQHPASTLPESLSLFPVPLRPSLETENGDGERISEKPKRKQSPAAPGADAPADGSPRVVAVWFEQYQKRYGQKPKWGGKHGRQLKQLLANGYTADELCELVPYFFAWKRPDVIKAGHSWGTGYACFVLKLDELRADMVAPERRIEAAQATDAERNNDRKASTISQAERVAAKLAGETSGNDDDIQEGITTGTARPEQAHLADARAFQSKAIG